MNPEQGRPRLGAAAVKHGNFTDLLPTLNLGRLQAVASRDRAGNNPTQG
jgi:hypothetical protein